MILRTKRLPVRTPLPSVTHGLFMIRQARQIPSSPWSKKPQKSIPNLRRMQIPTRVERRPSKKLI
jgi:hypothetical protein